MFQQNNILYKYTLKDANYFGNFFEVISFNNINEKIKVILQTD